MTALTLALVVSFLALAARQTHAQSSGSPNLVISQVYTRGGEPGATYRSDLIEIYNRGTQTINFSDYSLQITSGGQSVNVAFVSSRGHFIGQGQYFLIELTTGGANGNPLPIFAQGLLTFNLDGAGGKIALVRNREALPAVQCPLGQDPDIEDYVGYGNANCAEGTVAPAQTVTTALIRNESGCADTDNNGADFSVAAPNPRNTSSPRNFCNVGSGPTSFQFTNTSFLANEHDFVVGVTVMREGDISFPASVDYATTDGTATDRHDYTTSIGTLQFAPGELTKDVVVLITNDALDEPDEPFTVMLSNPSSGGSIATRGTATVTIFDNDGPSGTNPLEQSQFFVRQHYHDFLNRSPDTQGLFFWSNQIEGCGNDTACREIRRINVSAAFFLSIEFQQTGYLVHRIYKAAFPETPARPRTLPRYREFMRDTQEIGRGVVVNSTGWEQQLEANKQAFVNSFVTRTEFTNQYPQAMTAAQYVDALNANAGGVLSQSERDALVAGLQNNTETRASALRKVAEDNDMVAREFNRAFVLMQYIGYLRRNPNDPPDNNFNGYDFWLQKLNQFGGNFINAEMVKSFLISKEYRERFGPQ